MDQRFFLFFLKSLNFESTESLAACAERQQKCIMLRRDPAHYYSINREMIYGIDKKIKWKKDKNGYRVHKSTLVPHMDYLPDSISDELVVLKKIPRKTKK